MLSMLGLGAAAVAHAQSLPCPNSEVQLGDSNVADYTSAALDTSHTYPTGTYRAAYNLLTGALHFEKPLTSNFGHPFVIASDRYDIAGPAPGTIVPLTVEFDVNGYVESAGDCGGSGCSGFFGARMFKDGVTVVDQSVSVGFTGRADLIQALQFPTSITVGQPTVIQFQLYYFVQAGGDHYGGIGDGAFHFTGLPAGAALISCQGFGGLPTEARHASWGKLKTIYR
jgi:hypothetical protein